MTVIKIVPMPGVPGANGLSAYEVAVENGFEGTEQEWLDSIGANLTVPVTMSDSDGDDFITFTRTGTGTARIETPQDDLSLRSARDITLYPGSDGPGKVYIGWGDAEYTPNNDNEVATIGYVDEATGASSVKYVVWGYPSNNAIAIMPATDNESIALKSSDAAAIRWHVRNAVDLTINPTSAEVTQGDGNYQVVFTIPEQTSVPPTGEYYYHISCPNNSAYDASLFAQYSTTTSITFYYETDPGAFDPSGAYINLPSVYAQYEVDSDGAHIKVANWTSDQGSYSQQWDFTKEGAIHFPYGPSNSRTGYGDVLRFATSFDQSIITGSPATDSTPNANRLVIAGQDGYDGQEYDGEGGDIYLWAGQGGGTNGNGGDIKIDGGNGVGTGQGGYVKVRGGYSDDGTGGYINIDSGDSNTGYGGPINIRAGSVNSGDNTSGGSVNIESGYSNTVGNGGDISLTSHSGGALNITTEGEYQYSWQFTNEGVFTGPAMGGIRLTGIEGSGEYPLYINGSNGIVLGTSNGEGYSGVFLENSEVPENEVATHGYVTSTLGTYPMIYATDGSPLTGILSHVGKLLYANLSDVEAYYTIPTSSNVNFPIGCEIKFATSGNSAWYISAEDTEVMTFIGEGGNGYYGVNPNYPFIVPSNSTGTLIKVDTDRWILSCMRLTD